jgi:peroxiredoxin
MSQIQIKVVMVFSLMLFLLISFSAAGEMSKAENFTLKDYTGKSHSLTDYKDSKAIVVMFIATQCPVSNDYNSRMAALYKDYHEKNVAFLAINSNKQESLEEITQHSQKNGFQFPVLKDPDNGIADRFNAQVTPEIFVLNSDFDILYHGRIDDSQRESEIKSSDLRNALEEILAGKPVSRKETKAFGCSIKRMTK